MKLHADQLRDALKLLKPVWRKNTFEPIKRVLIEYDGEYETKMTATNIDVWMTISFSGSADSDPLSLLVDPLQLEEALKLDDHDVHLTLSETDPERILVSSASSSRSTEIMNYDPIDFPQQPDYTPSDSSGIMFQLDQSDWSELRERVFPYAATDDSRPVLACVSFEDRFGNAVATAADGFRLSSDVFANTLTEFKPFLLALPSLKLIPAKLTPGGIDFSSLGDEHAYVMANFGYQRTSKSHKLFVMTLLRKVEGRFPDYTQIVPRLETLKGSFTAPLWLLEEAAKLKHGSVFLLKDGKATLTFQPVKGMDLKPVVWESIAIRFYGDVKAYALNPGYLYTAAQKINNGIAVTVQLAGSFYNACLLRDHRTHTVLMPMVLPEKEHAARKAESAVAAD